MTKQKPTGPEKPTIVEKLVSVLPGSYFLKCLTFCIVFGTPGMVLTRYLDTFDLTKATAIFSQLTPQDVFIFSMANFVMPLYAFYGIGYMRRKLVEAMPEFESLTVGGRDVLAKVFGSVSKSLPVLILGGLFAVLSIASFPGQAQHVAGYSSLVVKVVGFSSAVLAYGTFVWVYASSIRSIHQVGKENLQLVSFYEDSHLGMKPLGSLSLSFTWVYFLGLGLVFFSANPFPIPLLFALLGLILLGAIVFFLPLRIVHIRMAKEKRTAEKLLRKHLAQIVISFEQPDESTNDISDLLAFQLLEQKVVKISEWPLDTTTLSWFSAIVITVLGTIIARYLLIFLGL